MPAEDRPRGDCRGTSGLREARKPPDRDSQAPPLAPRQEAAPGTKWLLSGEHFRAHLPHRRGSALPNPAPGRGPRRPGRPWPAVGPGRPVGTYMRGPRSEENSQWNTTMTRLPSAGEMGFLSRKSSTSSSMCRFTAPCEDTAQHRRTPALTVRGLRVLPGGCYV